MYSQLTVWYEHIYQSLGGVQDHVCASAIALVVRGKKSPSSSQLANTSFVDSYVYADGDVLSSWPEV